MPSSVAQALISAFAKTGTRRLFGLPGGGSSLDLIEAGRAAGMPFVLARHEGAALMMAATTAELDGSIGVALVTKGPGTANAANGVAHASLDRCAVAAITDGFTPAHQAYVTHQWYDQKAFLAPVVKAHSTLAAATKTEIASLVGEALAPRQGPVHLELTGAAARAAINAEKTDQASTTQGVLTPAPDKITAARSLLAGAKKPIVVCGLEARDKASTVAVRKLVATLECPALVTYKAKGVIADLDPAFVGIFTGGAAEKPAVLEADLIILIGLDPVELILQPWAYETDTLELSLTQHPLHYLSPTVSLIGDLAATLEQLHTATTTSHWPPTRVRRLGRDVLESLRYGEVTEGLSPEQVVTLASEQADALPKRPRVTVDAGAHMFSATTFWPCEQPNDLLISNGLASMGFALPAGIAAALHEPDRPVIAFTGDGGLLMCIGELATAIEQGGRLIVIVFNDGALSLIDIKQQQRELAANGVRWPRQDFAAMMQAFGGIGLRASTASEYTEALDQAFASDSPVLIDVLVDPTGYPQQLRALRG